MGESYYAQEAFGSGVYDNLRRNTENDTMKDILKELKEINTKLDSRQTTYTESSYTFNTVTKSIERR